MKACSVCKLEKPLDSFHRNSSSKDGRGCRCKSCSAIYDKNRAGDPKRVEARKRYAKTDNGRIIGNRAKRKWINNNPIKRRAEKKVQSLRRSGKLKPLPCEVCGSDDIIHAHHCDYSKPLEIKWLCPLHHTAWHREFGEGLNG